MNNHTPQQSTLPVAYIIWGALSFSMIVYGAVLYITGKISFWSVPAGTLQPLEMAALAMNLVMPITFFLYRSQVEPQKDFQKKFPMMVVCWAMNESIAVMAFAATFVGETGNGFFYSVNLAVALLGNFLTRPQS